ncbi:MAG: N5-carboxyaminoimidazole ribonucleotide mutase [Candidatus Hydrogenedentota bacterium]
MAGAKSGAPRVAVVMGSKSDWDCMKNTSDMLKKLEIEHECRVLSAHRTPNELFEYMADAEKRGVQVFIAAAGGAAHLAGVVAAKTTLPVLGVPMQSKSLQGLDSLLSMVQMPKGIPVATLAIGDAGAGNAALFAAAILALQDEALAKRIHAFREEQSEKIRKETLDY